MFVYDFIQVGVPYPWVRQRVLADEGAWLAPCASAAYGEAQELRVRVGPGSGPLSKEVAVEVGAAREHGGILVVPLRWRATGGSRLFPELEADLRLWPFGSSSTQVSLSGIYDPPLGALGRGLDRLVLHGLAEATVRGFLRRLAAALEQEPAVGATSRRFGGRTRPGLRPPAVGER